MRYLIQIVVIAFVALSCTEVIRPFGTDAGQTSDGSSGGTNASGGIGTGGVSTGGVGTGGATCQALTQALTVMPLGDSITAGVGAEAQGGYRGPFFKVHPGFISMGSVTSPQGWHEGHPSFTSKMILDNLPVWYAAASPADIVLLLIGANDYLVAPADTAANVVAICGVIHQVNVHARVFVAQVLNSQTVRTTYNAVYDQQRVAVANAIAALPNVFSVTMPHLPNDAFSDEVHPNAEGEDLVAAAWTAAVDACKKDPGTACTTAGECTTNVCRGNCCSTTCAGDSDCGGCDSTGACIEKNGGHCGARDTTDPSGYRACGSGPGGGLVYNVCVVGRCCCNGACL